MSPLYLCFLCSHWCNQPLHMLNTSLTLAFHMVKALSLDPCPGGHFHFGWLQESLRCLLPVHHGSLDSSISCSVLWQNHWPGAWVHCVDRLKAQKWERYRGSLSTPFMQTQFPGQLLLGLASSLPMIMLSHQIHAGTVTHPLSTLLTKPLQQNFHPGKKTDKSWTWCGSYQTFKKKITKTLKVICKTTWLFVFLVLINR